MLRDPFSLSRDEPTLVRQERTRNRQTIQFNTSVSGLTRLDAAYDAILFSALAVFAAQGYRITAQAGHHRIAMEGLAASLGMGGGPHDELDALLDLRNSKYEGFESVDEPTLADALHLAKHILTTRHHPDLIAAS